MEDYKGLHVDWMKIYFLLKQKKICFSEKVVKNISGKPPFQETTAFCLAKMFCSKVSWKSKQMSTVNRFLKDWRAGAF